MLGWTDTETCCPKQVKADGSLASLASDTGALSSAMHTSERHHVGMAAAMSPEASPPYSNTNMCKLAGLNGVVAVCVAFSVTALIQTMLYGW